VEADQQIDELRRRIQADPASVAFLHLAEAHRRSGALEEAVRVCRHGLDHHPGYQSARVTLGRTLVALGRTAEAAVEFRRVLETAPGNVIAQRGLADLGMPAAPPDPVLSALEAWLDELGRRRAELDR
jgi:Flp pilus assembly protein TadD